MAIPTLVPLGDAALLVRFSEGLSDSANRAALAAAEKLRAAPPAGVVEIVPGLVSVLLRYRAETGFLHLSGDVQLLLAGESPAPPIARSHTVPVRFDGEDLAEVARLLHLSPDAFVVRHNARPLRVLATGFAPGFVYCGFHESDLVVPRRRQVHPIVAAGTLLFAAGQTAIAATPIRTGWHVIGHTTFQNFDPQRHPPTTLQPGDMLHFEVDR